MQELLHEHSRALHVTDRPGRVGMITARVIPGARANQATRQARLMGGVEDADEGVWRFRMTPAFELKGGVLRLRRSGVLPLQRWSGERLEATWIDCEDGGRVMRWQPVRQARQ
jgi:hypothetical protein